MIIPIFVRSFIGIVLLSVVIVSFSFGIIGLNEMCASNPDTCPWNPPQKLLASFIVSGILCFFAIVFSIMGLIECCDAVSDDISYDKDIYCFHGVIFIIITALLAVIVVLMAIIYSAMPRSFDRATLIFFLVVTHLVGGFSISWAFVPVGCDYSCIRLDDKTRWLVRIFIDREGGATLEDCTSVSHQVGDLLNVHDLPPGPYTLEVSTPGLDRPLTRDKDFEKYRGARVRIRTREAIGGSRNFLGAFIDYAMEDGRRIVTVDVDGRTVRIDRDNIQKANLEYERQAPGDKRKAPVKGKKSWFSSRVLKPDA